MALAPALPIQHDGTARRFGVVVEGHACELTYRLAQQVMTITHTWVPEPVAGRGIAAQLTRAALDLARAQGWKVIPACSYARVYIARHPDEADLLARELRSS